jgi:hypothetical protein
MNIPHTFEIEYTNKKTKAKSLYSFGSWKKIITDIVK